MEAVERKELEELLSSVDLFKAREYFSEFEKLMAYYRCAIMEIETKFNVLNEEYSLLQDPKERSCEAGSQDKSELVSHTVRPHGLDPFLHLSYLTICQCHTFLTRINVEDDSLFSSRYEAFPWLPPEC